MAAEMFRRTKLLRWIKEQSKMTEILHQTVPDSKIVQSRIDMLNDLCKHFEVELDEIQI